MLASSNSLLRSTISVLRRDCRTLKAENGFSKRSTKSMTSSARNRVLTENSAFASLLPRISLYAPSIATKTPVRHYMQSSQLYSNTKASAGASTAPNSKDSLAAQLRSLMDSGDTDAAFELLTSKDDKEFDYNEETMTVVTDLVATGILVHPFPSFSHQMNWSSTLNHMPRHFIEKFATDLMERGRYVEAVDILQRRAMVIHRKLRDPNATSIVIPNSLELIQAFATAKTDDIDVEWQLSSWLEWTSIFGDTLIPYICAQSLMTRYPAEIKYQLLFIRTAYVFYLTHKQNGASAQAVADSFLKVLAGLDHDLSPVFRQHMMECLIAAGSIDRAIALGSSSPYLFPWLYHAKIEGKHASYDQETVAAGVPNATSMLECIQWARLAHLNDHPSEAIAIVKELASARTKLSGTDKSLLFLFVSTELPLNPTTFAIMESLTPNAPALLRMVAATAVLHGNPTKGAELLDTAKLFSPESTLTSTLRAMIAENQGRLDEALALNEAIYSEGASIAATSRILRLYLKMGNFEKFISLYGYIARIKERNLLESEFVDGNPKGRKFLLVELQRARCVAGNIASDDPDRPKTPKQYIDYEEAISIVRELVTELSSNPSLECEARYTWAAALEALGSEKEAKEQIRRIKQLEAEIKSRSPF